MDNVSIVVPVKDEEIGLKYLLEDFTSSGIEKLYSVNFIFIIDERTNDNSLSIAKNFTHQTIDQSSVHGKGAAIKQAIEKINFDELKYIVFLDADGSYSFEGVKTILSALDDGCDVCSGSRFVSSKGRPLGMSRLHNLGNRLLSLVSSLKNRRKITDLCTGLWGFKSSALAKLEIKANGFDLEAEIAGQVRKNTLAHREVAVEWSQRKGGTSKLRSIRDGAIIFFRILRT